MGTESQDSLQAGADSDSYSRQTGWWKTQGDRSGEFQAEFAGGLDFFSAALMHYWWLGLFLMCSNQLQLSRYRLNESCTSSRRVLLFPFRWYVSVCRRVHVSEGACTGQRHPPEGELAEVELPVKPSLGASIPLTSVCTCTHVQIHT